MASEMIDMCTMGGSDISGGVPFGAIEDISKSPLDKLPMPQQPAMVHGTGMAGETEAVKDPWPMSQMR